MRGATRGALENLVTLAIDRAVDFVVIAGDLYDGDWKDHNTGLFLSVGCTGCERRVSRRDDQRQSRRSEQNDESRCGCRTMSNCCRTAARPRRASPVLRDLGSGDPRTVVREAAETSNLAREYPEKKAGMLNIGLLQHFADRGREEHATYAPCDLDDLRSKCYDYGHWDTLLRETRARIRRWCSRATFKDATSASEMRSGCSSSNSKTGADRRSSSSRLTWRDGICAGSTARS